MATRMLRRLVRSWSIAALLLIAVVTAGALAWTASPASPHTYTATRTLRISMLPADGAGTYEASVAQAYEAALARVLASPGLLTSPTYTAAVIGRLGGSRAFGANGGLPTAAAVEQALRASHTGGNVTLGASWDTPDGASALADAAVQTLATAGAQSILPDGSSSASMVERLGAPARFDGNAEAGRAAGILLRGGLAVLTVLILAGALAATEVMRGGDEGATGERSDRGALTLAK